MSPLGELMAVLRERGLPIGVREHLTVGRLLERWQGTDPEGLKVALAAVLARNPDEVRLIREAFDELYVSRQEVVSPPPPPAPRRSSLWRSGRVAGLVLALFLIASSLAKDEPRPVAVPPAVVTERSHRGEPPPPPPEISETFERPAWAHAVAGATGSALLVLLWLYGTRLQLEAGSLGRRLWRRKLEFLPRPYSYKLAFGRLAPALPAVALDQTAWLLGRSPAPPRADDLDVDRSLESTLRAGLAPQIVLRERSSPRVLVVLRDTAGEMRPWHRSVNALLAGLGARGVPLDVWLFHADASRVFRSPGSSPVSLERLARLQSGSPLLVISTGEGLATGREGRRAAWVATLAAWKGRAWLHPVTDAGYWRPQLRQVGTEVWPLTPGGVIAAAHHLAAEPAPLRARFPIFPHRPVVPLDVDRLRWLLFLAPRRDPNLGELLRQRFFPRLPPAALLEALEAPPLHQQPGTRPSPTEVHDFLTEVLAESRPEPGSAAHGRWSLDRAVQESQVPARRAEGLLRLEKLASGPFAGEVEQAVRRLPGERPRNLLKAIGKSAVEGGLAAAPGEGRRHWRWPDGFELGTALLCGLLLAWGLGRWLAKPEPVELLMLYKLQAVDPVGHGPVYLRATRNAGAPASAHLYRQDESLGALGFQAELAGVSLDPSARGNWYYLRAWIGPDRDSLAVSNSVWVRSEDPVGLGAAGYDMPIKMTPDAASSSTGMTSEPMVTEPLITEDLGTDVGTPSPAGEGENIQFGTLGADLTIRGAPEVPVEGETAEVGTLTIAGYPRDLPSQMLHIVGPGQPRLGEPWNGEDLKLDPGEYLLVAHTPSLSIGLATATIKSGSVDRIQISEEGIRNVRQALVLSSAEGGPRIAAVTSEVSDTGAFVLGAHRRVEVSIRGNNFDPRAKVSMRILPVGASLGSCRVQTEEIRCSISIDIPSAGPRRGEVRVINPDGYYAAHEIDIDYLLRGY